MAHAERSLGTHVFPQLRQHPSVFICKSRKLFPCSRNLSFQTVVDALQVVLLGQQAVQLFVSLLAKPSRRFPVGNAPAYRYRVSQRSGTSTSIVHASLRVTLQYPPCHSYCHHAHPTPSYYPKAPYTNIDAIDSIRDNEAPGQSV